MELNVNTFFAFSFYEGSSRSANEGGSRGGSGGGQLLGGPHNAAFSFNSTLFCFSSSYIRRRSRVCRLCSPLTSNLLSSRWASSQRRITSSGKSVTTATLKPPKLAVSIKFRCTSLPQDPHWGWSGHPPHGSGRAGLRPYPWF